MYRHEIPTRYADYDCRVNAMTPEELFDWYEATGFLYPEKKKAIAPYRDLIAENWRRAFRGGELIHHTLTRGGGAEEVATISSWRSTSDGFVTQHLVSNAGIQATRDVMLAKCGSEFGLRRLGFHQNWFQPHKGMPRRTFGSMVENVGAEFSDCREYGYWRVETLRPGDPDAGVHVVPLPTDRIDDLRRLATAVRGTIYVEAEELDREDIELESTDQLYRLVGLRRYRRIWTAFDRKTDRLIGAAVAWRGPLGFNFSFLENRCDLILAPDLDGEARCSVSTGLLNAASDTYRSFEPGGLYVTTEAEEGLQQIGGTFLRRYAQSIWGRPTGYERWYRHIENVYDTIERRLAAREAHRKSPKGEEATR